MENIQEQKEQGFNLNLAVNEIESDGEVYLKGKPSEEEIKQLRFIKERRFNNMLESGEAVKESLISYEVAQIQKARGLKREEILKAIVDKVLIFLKNSQGFSRETLNSIVEPKTKNNKTLSRLTNSIIKTLLKANKIKKKVIKLKTYAYENNPLYSFDYGSFSLLMKANKNKPRNKQGCFTNGNMSVIRREVIYNKYIYEFI